MNVDKLTRGTAVAAVLAVAGVAGWVSYWHCTQLVTAHGEPGLTGHLYAATIDGLIVAASMVLLDAARHDDDSAPRLAWWMLGAGIGATLTVNVLAGLASGWLGAVIAGWPAAAFVASYELLMILVRASSRRVPVALGPAAESAPPRAAESGPASTAAADPAPAPVQLAGGSRDESAAVPADVPRDAEHAALLALRGSIAGGNPLSQNKLMTRFGLTRAQAVRVRNLALGDDGDRQEEDAAKALLGLPRVPVARLRRIGEPEHQDDDAPELASVNGSRDAYPDHD